MTCNSYEILRYDAVGAMRAMEKFTQEVGGYPFLYADIFMTREEFEEMLKYVFKDKFNFLLIDTNEDYRNMYHKNLNKRLIFHFAKSLVQ